MTAAEVATGMMKVGSFHDLSKWEEHEASLEEHEVSPPRSPSTPRSTPGVDVDGGGSSRRPPKPFKQHRAKSMRLFHAISPGLVNATGSAFSGAGVAAAAGVGVAVCHALRLLIREALEALPRALGMRTLGIGGPSGAAATSLLRARTFELYILSLLHHGAWVFLGLKRCLQKEGWTHDTGGATRALCLSAGYHLYVLLSINSIWTHPLVTLQQVGELIGISAELRSRGVGWTVPLSGALRSLPHLFLSACSALEHLGEPVSSYPFRFLRIGAVASIVGAKAVATPCYLRATLTTRPELHQPTMLPRKLVSVADAAVSVLWLASHFALHRAYRQWHQGAPSVVAPRLLAIVRAATHQLKMTAAAVAVSIGLQALYLVGPAAVPALAVAAARLPSSRARLRLALVAALGGLIGLACSPLPAPSPGLMRALLVRSGLGGLLKSYHSWRLIEEAPLAQLPTDRGSLFACFPHGVMPYGVILLWLDRLERGAPIGGLGASVLFLLPVLRQWLALGGIVSATAKNLQTRLREPRAG